MADAGGDVFRLGHPLTIRLVPSTPSATGSCPNSHFAPYVTIGLGATSYKETSDVAGLIETQSATKFSGHGALGIDYLAGPLRFGVEVGYSTVPNTIGESGVSKVYGEKDVGGLTVLARLASGPARPSLSGCPCPSPISSRMAASSRQLLAHLHEQAEEDLRAAGRPRSPGARLGADRLQHRPRPCR